MTDLTDLMKLTAADLAQGVAAKAARVFPNSVLHYELSSVYGLICVRIWHQGNIVPKSDVQTPGVAPCDCWIATIQLTERWKSDTGASRVVLRTPNQVLNEYTTQYSIAARLGAIVKPKGFVIDAEED